MIEKLLRKYRQDKSKLDMLKIEERQKLFELGCINDQTQYISAVKLSDMPRSITNKFVSSVENIAMQREKDQHGKEPILFRLAEISQEKFELQCQVDKVEALLQRLGMEERFVIEMHYIENLCWSLVVEQYKNKFGQYRSIPALKRKRDIAFVKLVA